MGLGAIKDAVWLPALHIQGLLAVALHVVGTAVL